MLGTSLCVNEGRKNIYRNEDKGNDPGKFGVANKEKDANEMM